MDEYIGFRDAVHVPFIVITCKTAVSPGEKLSLRHDNHERIGCVKWCEGDKIMWHGVADMFAEGVIPPDQPFRLYIRKECFAKLTHYFDIDVNDRGGTDTCHSVCNIF